jgi:hypothetical protein
MKGKSFGVSLLYAFIGMVLFFAVIAAILWALETAPLLFGVITCGAVLFGILLCVAAAVHEYRLGRLGQGMEDWDK